MQNRLREINTLDLRFKVYDYYKSWAYASIAREIGAQYYSKDIEINDGDVIVDIGAHVGIFSIYYAIKYPNARIFSYEPSNRNFSNLEKSIEHNRVNNIKAHHAGVSSDGRTITIAQSDENSGASSRFINGNIKFEVGTVTLNDIFKEVGGRVKILKIDCEGSEYEVLNEAGLALLKNVEYVMGELHWVSGSSFNPHILHDQVSSAVGRDHNLLTILPGNI